MGKKRCAVRRYWCRWYSDSNYRLQCIICNACRHLCKAVRISLTRHSTSITNIVYYLCQEIFLPLVWHSAREIRDSASFMRLLLSSISSATYVFLFLLSLCFFLCSYSPCVHWSIGWYRLLNIIVSIDLWFNDWKWTNRNDMMAHGKYGRGTNKWVIQC